MFLVVRKCRLVLIFFALGLIFSAYTVVQGVVSMNEPASSYTGRDIKKILLDPGHGGEDGGASSRDGILEKDLNLRLTLFLRDYLIGEGYEVIMTRESDVSIHDSGAKTISAKKNSDLRNRRKMIKTSGADVFISIHMNSFPESKYKGAQVFYAANSEISRAFAQAVQDELRLKLSPENSREIKKADNNIYILREAGSSCCVLVECGFLSNPEEAALLNTDEYLQKIASAIKASVINFDTAKQQINSAIKPDTFQEQSL